MANPSCILADDPSPRRRRGRGIAGLVLPLVLAAPLAALDLPGIPAPGAGGRGEGQVAWGNDAFGPGGGTKSDDFRTNQFAAAVAWGPVVVGVDHSLLTATNPHGRPIYWGLPDPFLASREDAARQDELAVAAALRGHHDLAGLDLWGQAGPGLLVSGDLGGGRLQTTTHDLLSQAPFDLAYERSRLEASAFAHAGAGAFWPLAGPLTLAAGALAQASDRGGQRWQAEVDLALRGPGGGAWLGVRSDGHAGASLGGVAAVVAQHEDGTSLVAGFALRSPAWGISVETARNLDSDGQMGRFTVRWDDPVAFPARAGGERWCGRVGLLPYESRVAGRGLDYVLGYPIGAMSIGASPSDPLLALVGFRDQELSTPYTGDLAGHRQMVWAGIGCGPELARTGPLAWQGWVEAGLGWRHGRTAAHGFLTLDGGDEVVTDAAIARLALGLAPTWSWSRGVRVGLLALAEGLAASTTRGTEIAVHDPFDHDEVRKRTPIDLEGSALGAILALTGAWEW